MAEDDEICTRISESVKMAGFLEKKGKMKIVSTWKKYWFVLEERLLLYYRSEVEYINLSPCRGSLNMGLVTTVKPGSSAGPCTIHVVTRTQVVQLRAKNRATQEEWLQALLDSMSLPLFSKTLKTPLVADLHGHRYSMDNIHSGHGTKRTDSRYRNVLDHRKKERSESFYGGSLDTVVWSAKFKTSQNPIADTPKNKVMDKLLGYVEEVETKSTSDMVSLIDDDDDEASSSSASPSKRKGTEEDDVHIQEEKSDFSNQFVKISRVRCSGLNMQRKSLSDNEVNKIIPLGEKDEGRGVYREGSQLKRIKNAVRKTRDKAFKSKLESDRKPSVTKKRRQSFLQKVFKMNHKTEEERNETEDSNVEDPLYDTIENVQEQKDSLISSSSDCSPEPVDQGNEDEPGGETTRVRGKSHLEGSGKTEVEDTRKPIFGSKSILTTQAMSELKTKLKSRENSDGSNLATWESVSPRLVTECASDDSSKPSDQGSAPDLPPRRRHSRPRSPWHDVPVNNSPVGVTDAKFSIHHAGVKFRDDVPLVFSEIGYEAEREEIREEKTTCTKDSSLSHLLEQLTEMTVAPLTPPNAGPHPCSDEEGVWGKQWTARFSEPDYDIPRPHKPMNLCISDDGHQSRQSRLHGKCDDNSDSSCSFHSMEPDSLESAERRNRVHICDKNSQIASNDQLSQL